MKKHPLVLAIALSAFSDPWTIDAALIQPRATRYPTPGKRQKFRRKAKQ